MDFLNWRTWVLMTGYILLLVLFAQAPALSEDPRHASEQVSALPLAQCAGSPYSIALNVRNVRSSKGLITVDVHDDNPEGFLNNDGLVERVRGQAEAGITQLCVPVPAAGTYALALYHDRDGDWVFDKNWLGLPSEPYGISNDPPIRLKAPPHKAAAFTVDGPAVPMTVTLRGR